MEQEAKATEQYLRDEITKKPEWVKEFRINLKSWMDSHPEDSQMFKHVVDNLRADGHSITLMTDCDQSSPSQDWYYCHVCRYGGLFGLRDWWCQWNASRPHNVYRLH